VCEYIPKDNPAVILWNPTLTDRELLLALVHELTHACLHPPGCDDFVQDEYDKEEPCSHEAADIICRDYGVSDFQDVMLKRGVKSEGLKGNDNETVEVMVERVQAALASSDVCPDWATPVDDKFRWRAAKAEAGERWRHGPTSRRRADLQRDIYGLSRSFDF
jgi:hypothetical protein